MTTGSVAGYLTPTQVANLPDGTPLAVEFPDSDGPVLGALLWVDDRPSLEVVSAAGNGYRHSLRLDLVRVRLA